MAAKVSPSWNVLRAGRLSFSFSFTFSFALSFALSFAAARRIGGAWTTVDIDAIGATT